MGSGYSSVLGYNTTTWVGNLTYTVDEFTMTCNQGFDYATFVDGTVARRNHVTCGTILPNGANASVSFNMFNISGELPWGNFSTNVTYVPL